MAFMYPHHLPDHPFYEDFLNVQELLEKHRDFSENDIKPINKILVSFWFLNFDISISFKDDERNLPWAPRSSDRAFENNSMSMRLVLDNSVINDESSNHSLDDSGMQQFRHGDYTDEASQSNDDGEDEMGDSREEDDDDV